MDFIEKDLEQIIYESDRSDLFERGLALNGKLYRQLRIGNYGTADLISVYKEYDTYLITVYELKKNYIGESTFFQALKYAKGIIRYLKKRNAKIKYKIEIVLIGKGIDLKGNLCYITDILDSIHLYTYSYKANGILFEYHPYDEYYLKNEGF